MKKEQIERSLALISRDIDGRRQEITQQIIEFKELRRKRRMLIEDLALFGMMKREDEMTTTYSPLDSKRKCGWITCFAGMGLAGTGYCFAGGMWWAFSCPEYQDETEYLEEWRKNSEERMK